MWAPGTDHITDAQMDAIRTRDANAIRPIPSQTALGHDHLMADSDRAALIAEIDRLRDERETLAANLTAEFIGNVLREHELTTGMAVASGHTCRCNYWNGCESPGRTRPVGYYGLIWHQAQMITAALMKEEGSAEENEA